MRLINKIVKTEFKHLEYDINKNILLHKRMTCEKPTSVVGV